MPLLDFFRRIKESRRRYRVAHGNDSRIVAHLVEPDGELVEVDLVDSSAGGLRFRFREDVWPAEIGSDVTLRLRGRHSARHVDVPCRIVHYVIAGDDPPSAGCRFLDAKEFYEEADPSLWRAFNRRTAFRVSPPAGEPIEVILRRGELEVSAPLLDISAGGLAVLLTDATLTGVEELEVDIPLPTSAPLPVTLRAEIRYRIPSEGGERAGLKFLLPLNEACPDPITDYVLLRQRPDHPTP